MKRFALLSLAVVLVLSGLVSIDGNNTRAQAETIKIGYVDVALVFDSYNKTKDQDKALSAKSQEKQAQRDSIVNKIRNMKNEIELLSEKQREKKQEQIDQEIRKLQDFDREAKGMLQRERDDMVREILKEIDTTINNYAKKKDYTIILNSRVLIYAQEQDDITQEIVKILNSKYKK
jgi:outer membrane protein